VICAPLAVPHAVAMLRISSACAFLVEGGPEADTTNNPPHTVQILFTIASVVMQFGLFNCSLMRRVI